MSGRTRLLVFLAGLACAAALVARIGIQALPRDLHQVGWTLVPVVLVWAVVYAMNTAAWVTLVDGTAPDAEPMPFAPAYAINVSAFALNYVTPFVALGGEALRASSTARWVGATRAAASVVAFRVVHTVGQLLFWLLTLPAAVVLLPRAPVTTALLAVTAVVLVSAALLLVGLLTAGSAERLLDVLRRVPLLARTVDRLERHRTAIRALDDALVVLARERRARIVLAVGIEVASRLVAALEYLLIARSVGAPVGYVAAVVIGSFSQLVMNALFFVPFEVGAKEGSLVAVFGLLGHAPHVALATAIASRLREMVWIAIGLALIWRRDRR